MSVNECMNEQQNSSRLRGLRCLELRYWCHVCHVKGLVCWTSSLSALYSIFLSQLPKDFDSSCVHSLATITILTYGVKNHGTAVGGTRELILTEMQRRIKYLSSKTWMEKDVDVLERIILMSKYDNRGVCIGLSWLRMKSNVLFCQEYKLLVPLKHGK